MAIKIDTNKLNSCSVKIKNNFSSHVQSSLSDALKDANNLASCGWESPARDKICNPLFGTILENYSSISNSVSNIDSYINRIIENYNNNEQALTKIFGG